jgi:hypothetical protein
LIVFSRFCLMELSISASCFFVESSIVDWELLVWEEFCWCNRMYGMM